MPIIKFGDGSLELAEFDLSIKYVARAFKRQNNVDMTPSRFSQIWEKKEKKQEARLAARKPALQPRERYRLALLRTYKGRSVQFYCVHERFLGVNKHKSVAPFYKEIYDELRAAELKVWAKTHKREIAAHKREVKRIALKQSLRSNGFSVLPIDPEWPEDVDFSVELQEPAPAIARKPRTRFDRSNLLIGPRPLPQPQRQRSRELLLKLALALQSKKQCRVAQPDIVVQKIVRILSKLMVLSGTKDAKDTPLVAEAQMEEEIVVDKKSNTILTNVSGQEIQQPIERVINDFWTKASTSDTLQNYEELSNRWHLLKNDVWKSNHDNGALLYSANLPMDFLKDNQNSPNFAPFAQYAYWKGDISIRIHINTTMFNVGSLIASWYYAASFDSQNSKRTSRYSLVQLPHVFINASDSTDIVFNIPFRSYKSMLSMYKKDNDINYASLGQLSLNVFNKLALSASDATTEVPYSIYISFPNSKFSGLIPRDDSQFTAEAQMFPLITAKRVVNLASDAMDMVIPDPNRDNPPVINRAMPVAPIPSSSWSSGNLDVDCVNPLRLEPAGQTPHPRGSTTSVDEMSIDYVKQQWGYLNTITWKTSNGNGNLLSSYSASPVQNSYSTIAVRQGSLSKACSVYTPVHNLANMFGYWRGELEIKLEIISSPLQVGSLIIGYCPRRSFTLSDDNSLSNIKSMYNAVIDLQSHNSFIFTVPYVADKPWWPVTAKKDDDSSFSRIDAPGKVFIAVLNKLVANKQAVPEYCYINVFMRAAPSFEVSLISNPRIGLSFDISHSNIPLNIVRLSPGYQKEFAVGVWRYVDGSKLVFRYGSGSDHVSQFLNLKPQVIYKITEGLADIPQFEYKMYSGRIWEQKTGKPQYLVRFIVNGDRDKYMYAAPFCTFDEARLYLAMQPSDKLGNSDTRYMLVASDSSQYFKLLDDGSAVRWAVPIESQMDDPIYLNTASSSLASTSSGHLTYGERVTSLKSVCRRYQHYKSISFNPIVMNKTNNLSAGLLVPLLPDGLNIDENNIVENLQRQGLIGYICSAYRFFRGGLRFRIVFRNIDTGMVYVQHIFDQELQKNEIKVLDSAVNTSHILQPGYAFCAQDLALNSVLTIETPYYLPTNLGLLQNPHDDVHKIESVIKSLGFLYINYSATSPNVSKNVIMDIFYSFADDMSLSCFIGFPPVFEVSTIESDLKPKKEEIDLVPSHDFVVIGNSGMPIIAEGQMPLFKKKEEDKFTIIPAELDKLYKYIIDLNREQILKPSTDGLASSMATVMAELDIKCRSIFEKRELDEVKECSKYFSKYVLALAIDKNLTKVIRFNDQNKFFEYVMSKYKNVARYKPSDFQISTHGSALDAKMYWHAASFREKIDEKVNEKISNFSQNLVTDSKQSIKKAIEESDASIWTYIKAIAEVVGGETKHILLSAFTQLMHIVVNPGPKTIAIAIVGVLTTIGLICTDSISRLIEVLSKSYEHVFKIIQSWASTTHASPSKTETGGAVPLVADAQMADPELVLSAHDKSALLSTIVAGVLGVVGNSTKISCKNLPDFASGLFDGVVKTARGANVLAIFFKNNIEMFYKILKYVTNKLFPQKTLQLTLNDELDYMRAWVEDCFELLHPDYADAVMTDPIMNVRVYQAAVVAEAYKLKALSSDCKVIPRLMATINKIIELRDKLAIAKISPPVRFEPWVLSISGESDIGKSHMAERIVNELLESINYTSYSEKIFTRTPGNQFWNGCRSQPVVLYDDFLQISTPEARAQDISELFCLKSKAVFNPPQAAIEEKHIRYNPLIVLLMCNEAFPQVPQCESQHAWRRRRDMLIKAVKNPRYQNQHPRDIDQEVSKDYGHIDFSIYASSVEPIFDKENINFKDVLEEIKRKFKNFYEQELKQYNDRLATATKFMPKKDESIEQTIDRYKRHLELINSKHVIRDAEIIFNGVRYKDNMIPKFLRRERVEAQGPSPIPMTSRQSGNVETIPVCYHHRMRPNWLFCENYPEMFLEQNDRVLAWEENRSTEVFWDPCDEKFETYVAAEPCDRPDCYWKMNHGKNYDEIMRKWKTQNRGLFERQEEILKSGEVCIVLPKYFRTSADLSSGLSIAHIQAMERLTSELEKIRVTGEEKMAKEAEKKGIKYTLIRTGKWILKQILRVFQFSIFALASYSVMNFVGGKLNIFPFDNNSKQMARDYVTESGCGNLNVSISDRVKNFFSKTPEKQVIGQMPYDIKVQASPATRHAILPKTIKAVAQMATDVETTVISQIERNSFFLSLYADNGTVRNMRCLGLFGHTCLILDHYYYRILSGDYKTAVATIRGTEYCINLEDLSYGMVDNSSFIVMRLPARYIPMFRDITKLFIPSAQSGNISTQIKLIETHRDRPTSIYTLPLSVRGSLIISNESDPSTWLDTVYEYAQSRRGLCLSVVCTTANTSSPIIGLHVAGTPDGCLGFAEPICRETVTNVSALFPDNSRTFAEAQLGPVEAAKYTLPYNLHMLGTVASKFSHHAPHTSTTCHTICAGDISDITYDYPLLSPFDSRISDEPFSPLAIGCSYHGLAPAPFDDKLLFAAFTHIKDKIIALAPPVRPSPGPLSLAEAVVGIQNLEHYDGIELSTSEGYPLVASRPSTAHDKRWLFKINVSGSYPCLDEIHPKLQDILQEKQTQREQNIVPFTVFTDCLKDIKLPKEKCLIPGKTRIFSISPVDFTIQCRQYFLDFAVAYQESRFNVDHAIGIDCNSLQWTQLASCLLSISNNIVVADYKKFGPTLMATCVWYAFEIMIQWYEAHGDTSPMNRQIREIMRYETQFSLHLMLNLIYQVHCGSPSGHPLTTIINSLVNNMYIMYSFLYLGFLTSEFDKYVKLVTYGDDLIMAVKDEILDKFNCKTISQVLEIYGIVLTDASKNQDVVMSRSLLDPAVTFLKRTFIPHPTRYGVYLACLDKRAVLEICNWTFKSGDLSVKSIESCLAMVENAFGFGEKEYMDLRARVLNWWLKRRIFLAIPLWSEVDRRCYDFCSLTFSTDNRLRLKHFKIE